jgi:hypothetical protein
MIIEAAECIEMESNVASQNEVLVGSKHFVPEVDDDNRGHDPFHAPERNIENLVSGHPSPGVSSGNGAANPGLSTSPGSRFSDPIILNHPPDEPNRMKYVATDKTTRDLCK